MAEESRPWAGTTLGDAGPYSADDWDDVWGILFGSEAAPFNNQGVIGDWLNELEVTDGGANIADVDTGAALAHGKFYRNTAIVNLAIPNSVGAWREDLVCLRSSWAAQTIRIYRHANPADGVGYPAPTQTDGSCWEIPLAAVRINNAGAITLITDLREYVHHLILPACKAHNSGNINCAVSGNSYDLDLDIEDFDTHTMHDNVVNPSRIYFPKPGKYLVIGQVGWEANATGIRSCTIRWAGADEADQVGHVDENETYFQTVSTIINVTNANVGTFVMLRVRQTSGGALNVLGGTAKLQVIWLCE